MILSERQNLARTSTRIRIDINIHVGGHIAIKKIHPVDKKSTLITAVEHIDFISQITPHLSQEKNIYSVFFYMTWSCGEVGIVISIIRFFFTSFFSFSYLCYCYGCLSSIRLVLV